MGARTLVMAIHAQLGRAVIGGLEELRCRCDVQVRISNRYSD